MMAPSSKALVRAIGALNETRERKTMMDDFGTEDAEVERRLLEKNAAPPVPTPPPPLQPPRLVREGFVLKPRPPENVGSRPKPRKPSYRVVRERGRIQTDRYHYVVEKRVLWFFWIEVVSYFDDKAAAVRRMNELQNARSTKKEQRFVIYPDMPEVRIETSMEGRLSLVDENEEVHK